MEKNTKKIALSIEEMKHLQELGVDTSKASMIWLNDNEWTLYYEENICSEFINLFESISAFTLQDILEFFPAIINKNGWIYDLTSDFKNHIAYKLVLDDLQDDELFSSDDEFLHTESGENILDMSYEMLCWCAENGFLKKGE